MSNKLDGPEDAVSRLPGEPAHSRIVIHFDFVHRLFCSSALQYYNIYELFGDQQDQLVGLALRGKLHVLRRGQPLLP